MKLRHSVSQFFLTLCGKIFSVALNILVLLILHRQFFADSFPEHMS